MFGGLESFRPSISETGVGGGPCRVLVHGVVGPWFFFFGGGVGCLEGLCIVENSQSVVCCILTSLQ